MEGRKKGQHIFSEESKVVASAKALIAAQPSEADDLLAEFTQLTDHYEKLLKVTKRIFRISDLQSKTLIEQEKKITEMNEDLLGMEKSRSHLLSNISHELGTPLLAIQGYVKAIQDGLISADEQYLSLIYQKLILVNHLINDLFELAKLQERKLHFHRKFVCLSDFFEQIRSSYELDVEERGFQFIMDEKENVYPAEPWYVYIDPIRIEQVMNNMISNALKYSDAGGEIRIQSCLVDRKEDSGFDLTGPTRVQEQLLLLKIIDSGPGIEEEMLPLLFDRFYRGNHIHKKSVQSTGLGLSIAKEIIEQQGGEIGVKSKLGEGSTFYFTLPISRHASRNSM